VLGFDVCMTVHH